MVIYVTICPMMPRFILDVRELYDRDLRGVYGNGRRKHVTVGRNAQPEGIDTGFGMLLRPIATSEDVVLSSISFADVATIDADWEPGGDSEALDSLAESEGVTEMITMQVLGDDNDNTRRV
ncbi:hypothetical protein JVU11DRAFT_10092 [Chiua virens]|nr:hypothetical protein JVU11DRAFT_10092 [Chiua virens]